MDNVNRVDGEGVSPWSRTHGNDFRGKLITFGSKVYLKATTERVHTHKLEDLAIVGVCAGCETTLGYGWSGTYLVWNLEDFTGVDLHQGSNAVDRRRIMPHLVK